jgi:DNA-binding GntR family transcriptional regulator
MVGRRRDVAMDKARQGMPDRGGPAAPGADGGRRSQTVHAYEEIRRRILENEMPAGSQYLEQELATRLGMSRTPVREALIRLAEDGLVEVRSRHGARVLPVSVDDMREIYELLTELEALAARRVAERGLAARELDRLDRCLAEMEAALARNDLDAWARHDETFHRLLIELSGNRRLVGVVENIWGQAHRVRMLTLRKRPLPTASNRDHAALVDAIRRRDPAAAAALHRKHREVAGAMLLKLIAKAGAEGL